MTEKAIADNPSASSRELPLVSVVLGTYNGERYLEEQLVSVLQQTYQALEIIAIDDGSTDKTVEILQKHAALDGRIKVFVNERNLGFVRNFEKGAMLSSGEWIAFCDQDDFWMPEKIEKMLNSVGDFPMIYCDSILCDSQLNDLDKRISDVANFQTFTDCRQLCVFSRMYGHATLVSRSLFDKARPFIPEMPHDGWLAFHATLYGGVAFLPEALVKYRQHESNVFGAVGRKWKKKSDIGRREKRRKEIDRVRTRMTAFYGACPERLVEQKKLLRALVESYSSFSIRNDIKRVGLFFANHKLLLAVKKYGTFRKYLFCLKMLVKIK